MHKPLVSVIINNYNYERFVPDAITSALNQSYVRVEVIVVDDGSNDGSLSVIEGFARDVRIVSKVNGGQSSAFNAGFAASSGEIICCLDADDLFASNKVEKIVEAYGDRAIGWCFHPLQYVDAGLRPIPGPHDVRYLTGPCDLRSEYMRGKPVFWAPPTTGLTFRRALLQKLLPMPPHIRITADNYLTFCAPAFAPGFYISDSLGLQRIHGANAYTAKQDPLLKAAVQLSIAKGMHDTFPELTPLANRLFANAVAAMLTAGAGFQDVASELGQYLANCAVADKAEVLARTAYRVLRPRRQHTRRLPEPVVIDLHSGIGDSN
ncbi:MAG: glycosyltransferase [Candidatus Sulfotelmatobacter sp.]